MKVGLDVTAAVVAMTGVSRYAGAVWTELLERDGVEVQAFAVGRGAPPPLPARRLPVPLRLVHLAWRLTGQPSARWLCGDVDVVHSLDLVPPPTSRPTVMTIHDVMPITHPSLFPPIATRRVEEQVEAARRAGAVVTTCRSTAVEIARVAAIPPERIYAAPLGPAQSPGGTAALDIAALPPTFLLAVGAVTPRKGLTTLVAALARLSDPPPLLIAGPDGWRAGDVRAEVARLAGRAHVTFLGALDDASLSALYRRAAVVCHPSLAEGFGIVCLEAAASGAAILATDLAPTRELWEGCAELVPSEDVEAMTAGLTRLLGDEALRRRLGDAARARASAYTWKGHVDGVLSAYRAAVA